MRECGEHLLLTHYGAWNFAQAPDGTILQQPAPSFGGKINYECYLSELERIGYTGYVVSEYCLPCVKDHRLAGIEEVDRATAMSLEYMKGLVGAPGAPLSAAR